jgi:hypothetical protein
MKASDSSKIQVKTGQKRNPKFLKLIYHFWERICRMDAEIKYLDNVRMACHHPKYLITQTLGICCWLPG